MPAPFGIWAMQDNQRSLIAESERKHMESRRLICDTEIPTLQPKLYAFSDSYRKSLRFLRAASQETAQYQAKIEEAKAEFREAEDDFVKAQGAKTRKEAEHMGLMDAIASAKTRVEDLKSSILEKRTKNSEYAKFLSQHSVASQGTVNESTEQKDELQEAISWYNTVLGFHVEGGDGVKSTFKNINITNPKMECFFTIRHENDAYTLLNCEPSLKGTKGMIHELNKTNGLYKFVRDMRRKFQEAVTQDLYTSSFRSDSLPRRMRIKFKLQKVIDLLRNKPSKERQYLRPCLLDLPLLFASLLV